MKKAEKNDVDFHEMKLQYERVFIEQVHRMNQLVTERELLHSSIQRIEHENASLKTIIDDNDKKQRLSCTSEIPTNIDVKIKHVLYCVRYVSNHMIYSRSQSI
jgi:hypothetical protein